jgi:probable phosphoglycerate mutase
MTTELILIRHGQSHANVVPIIGGMRGDTGLTPVGRDQAARLADKLIRDKTHAHALYASTLPRALETAGYVARALELPAQPDDDLQELRPGLADGLSEDEWRQRYPLPGGAPASLDFFDPACPGYPFHTFAEEGESIATFYQRAGASLERLIARHPDETVVAVTHGGVIRAAFYLALGLRPSVHDRLRLQPSHVGMSRWRYERPQDGDGHWTLLRYDELLHP